MTLHTVGPADMREDERVIGKGYKLGIPQAIGLVPFGVAYFADLKWVAAASFAILIGQGHETGGRLHDLCIRLRRTNSILHDLLTRSRGHASILDENG